MASDRDQAARTLRRRTAHEQEGGLRAGHSGAQAVALATVAQAGVTTTYTYDALGRLVAVATSGDVNNGLSTNVAL